MTLYQFKMLTEDDQCGPRVVIVYAEYLFLSPKDGIDLILRIFYSTSHR